MKLLSLNLRKFGHFTTTTLRFDDAPKGGLYLIHGPNEAGKTTALKAVRALLFGIPRQASSLAPGYEQTQLAIEGTVAFDNGVKAAIVRTKTNPKGHTSTLNGQMLAGGDEIDETWLHDKLGRPNGDMYEQIFAFSLVELTNGAALLSSSVVKGALFGAGLGGAVKPSDILTRLDEEMSGLFSEKGRKPPLNAAKSLLEELSTKVRDASRGSEAYAAIERGQRESDAAARAKLGELDALYKSQSANQALLAGLEVFERREASARELASLAVPRGFDPELGARALLAYADEERLLAADADAAAKIAAWDAEEATLSIDEAALAKASAIEERALEAKAQRQTRAELTELAAEDERDRQTTQRDLSALRRGWTLERLLSLALDEAALQRLRGLLDKATALDASLADAEKSERTATEAAAREADALAGIAAPEPIANLEAWRAQMTTADAVRGQVDDAAHTLRTLEKKREVQTARLDPQPASGVDLEKILPPSLEQITAARNAATKIETDRARAVEKLNAAEQVIARASAVIAQIDANQPVPTEPELTAARSERDRLGASLVTEPTTHNAQLYIAAVANADELVDKMRLRAEAVQRRAQHEEVRAQATVDRDLAASEKSAAVTLADTHDRAWKGLWATAKVAPLDPERMRAWRLAWEEIVSLATPIADARARVAELTEREASFVREGAALVGVSAETTSLGTLQKLAEAKVASEKARAKTHEEKRLAAAHHGRTQTDARARKAALEAERAAWADEWRAASSVLADGDAAFSAADARAVLGKLVELQRRHAANRETRAARRTKLTASHAAFDRAVSALLGASPNAARAANEANKTDAPSDSVTRIEAAHLAAKSAQKAGARRDEIARARNALLPERERIARERERCRTILQSARVAAHATDDATLRTVAARAREAERLTREIESADRELARLRGEMDADAFVAALRGTSEAMLRENNGALAADITRLQAERSTLHQQIGALTEQRKTFDGGAAATERAADLEDERARVKEQIERYAVAAIAHDLLTRGIHRFEREHQPRLLARAGELFSTMTGGSFVHVRQNLEGTLVVVRPDERELRTSELSTGTAEQLFLALRLAYIEAYARPGVEPLPVVLDDVLVNFDDTRALATLRALVQFSERTQVLFFTCHAHVIKLAEEASLGAPVLHLKRTEAAPAPPTFALTPTPRDETPESATPAKSGSARRRPRNSGP